MSKKNFHQNEEGEKNNEQLKQEIENNALKMVLLSQYQARKAEELSKVKEEIAELNRLYGLNKRRK